MNRWLLLARGALRRCPVCGQGRLFRRWFTMVERCPRCGLRFERIDGHWVGSLGMNTIVSFGALLVVVVGGLVLSHPDYDTWLLAGLAVGSAVVVPIAFFPFSRTLWTAIDLTMRPLEPGEVALEHHPAMAAAVEDARAADAGGAAEPGDGPGA